MAIWILKAVVQKSVSYLPYRHEINKLFQKHITKGLVLTDELFSMKLTHLQQHLYALDHHVSIPRQNQTTLELGAGWYPVIPVGLFISGVPNIYTVDIAGLMSLENIKQVVEKFLELHKQQELIKLFPEINNDKILALEQVHAVDTMEEALKLLNIKYLVGDLHQMEFNNKFTLIHSNNTFEHIYPKVLEVMLLHFASIVEPQGAMSHFIDLSDHFSHMDKSISPFNFLKYSENQWALIDNSIQPQNRLRINSYRELLNKSGWEIVLEENTRAFLDPVLKSKISSNFKKTIDSDLTVTHSWIITKLTI